MKPVRADDANTLLHAPAGEEDRVQDMYVRVEMIDGITCTTSTWMLDEEELQKVIRGANIKLTVWGPHPPALLSV